MTSYLRTMPAGRPSKYDPAFCDQLAEHMAQGLSIASFAAEIDVSRSTINQWAADYPEFSEALSRAKAKAAAAWERRAIRLADEGGSSAQSTMIIFGLRNMGEEDWREKVQTEHSGPNGGPINVRSARDLTDDELAKIAVGK